jgi:hypothetical protein
VVHHRSPCVARSSPSPPAWSSSKRSLALRSERQRASRKHSDDAKEMLENSPPHQDTLDQNVSGRLQIEVMSSQLPDRSHPVIEFAGRLSARLDQPADISTWTMRPEEQRQALKDLAKAETQLTKALEQHQGLADAMGRGRVNQAPARAIVKALEKLPATGQFAITPGQRARAEAHLIALAADHDAQALTLLGRHLSEVVAPDLAEQHDGKALEAEESAALRRTLLELREDDEGTCHGRFGIPRCTARSCASSSSPWTHPPASPTPISTSYCRPRSGTASRSANSSKPSRQSPSPRPAAARPPPPTHPRSPPPGHPPAQRQGHLPPTALGRATRFAICSMAAVSTSARFSTTSGGLVCAMATR